MSNFAERLKEYMTDRNLNVKTLAENLNVSRATISSLVHGAHTPSTKVFISISEYFDCSADYLLGLNDYPKSADFQNVKPFGGQLRKCLDESGKTEYRLQQDLDISTSLTYRWLANRATPTVESLIKLADYFGCSVDFLLGREN